MTNLRTIVLATLLVVGSAMAAVAETPMPESVTLSVKQFEGYTPKKGDVTFNHASHMHIACLDCHHTVADTYTFQGCMSAGCHDDITNRTEVNSIYRTFHTTKDTTKSCVGCHGELRRQGPSDAPLNCNSCHVQ